MYSSVIVRLELLLLMAHLGEMYHFECFVWGGEEYEGVSEGVKEYEGVKE